jgi:type II secretory pathway component GspD/PulD (secretin)
LEHVINLQVSPIEQVLNLYALLTGRSILRPTSLPAASITFRNEQELTREEAIQALDAVLALNGITMINVGDKFVSAVPSQQALQEGAAFSSVDPKELPEAGQFVTKVVTLKHALPSEVAQLLTGFAKMPNGVVPIDSTMTLVLRDYPANIKRMTEILERVDVEVESEYKLEVIPIKYGKVEDVYSTMSSLIGGGGGGVVGAAGPGAAQTGVTGVRRTGTTMRGVTGRTGGQIRDALRHWWVRGLWHLPGVRHISSTRRVHASGCRDKRPSVAAQPRSASASNKS